MTSKFQCLRLLAAVAMCVMMSAALVGCSSDDDGVKGTGGGKDDNITEGLVSTTVPSEGWSGTAVDGICTYRPSDQADEEFSTYYAFNFEDGKCKDAVFNIVCGSEDDAKYISDALNSGEWFYGDEEEEDYDEASMAVKHNSMLSRAIRSSKAVKSALRSTRAADVMGITCTQDGRIVYFKVEALAGLGGEDVKYVMETWDTGLNMDTLPSEPIFGTWDEATGKYTSDSIYAIPGTKVEIETAFDSSDMLTKYVAKFTMPNELWAESIEEALIEQADGYKQLFGIELEITRDGNVVTSNQLNVAMANVDKETLVKMIVAIDILNAAPIGAELF